MQGWPEAKGKGNRREEYESIAQGRSGKRDKGGEQRFEWSDRTATLVDALIWNVMGRLTVDRGSSLRQKE